MTMGLTLIFQITFCRNWHLAAAKVIITFTTRWLSRHHRAGPSASLDKSHTI
jgi:hypothetical protein